ncbi:hypothetical protein HHK36_030275 [Tetracentron sinense]|uniref:40S ribosomal protein S25 n=1 Tax=Tetracentron sinense TaxID=13715 RepID=A0A835D2I2_TETSI|nr:hypothetical protein HHK36_030275 [Tetracentron sinense]
MLFSSSISLADICIFAGLPLSTMVPPTSSSMGSLTIVITLGQGKGMDARHGSKTHDEEGAEEREGSATIFQARKIWQREAEEEGRIRCRVRVRSLNTDLWFGSYCIDLGLIYDKLEEKVNNMVLFDQASYDKLISEVPKYKLITPLILSDRLRV